MKMAAIPLLLLLAGQVQAQSALDGFDPKANGEVRIVVIQPDGKILIGGDFTTLSPNGGVAVTRNRIARLNRDGTLDHAFNPNANNTIYAIAVQADGKIIAAGDFNGANSIGGQTRNYIARLDATTGLADTFDPNANGFILSVAVQADGKILAGGFFTSIGGQTRSHIARLDPTTGAAEVSFDPHAIGFVNAIVMQPDGKILVGGSFETIGGQLRNYIARLDATTGLADSFNPNANNSVNAIVMQADGKILVGGGFTNIGGAARNRLARLDATTGVADSFDPNAKAPVLSIAVQTDGKILAGGYFFGANSIGGQTRNFIARLDSTTGLADSFDPNASITVFSIALQADARIVIGGAFTTLAPNGGAPVSRGGIARLETDGRLDQTLTINAFGAAVQATAVQPDGKILIGGNFNTILGAVRNNIARLNPDGTLDPAFNPNANSDVYSIAVQVDGKILAGGQFTEIGGQTRNRIARLNPNGTLDVAFNPNANNFVASIALQADGKILAGGRFNSIGGQTRNFIARLDATTGLADSFNPSARDDVISIAVQADGKILAGGYFFGANSIGGEVRNRIARLDASTGLADSFDPNANDVVGSIVVQPDGKILAGGNFSSIGGQPRNVIVRLDAATGLADSFNPDADASVGPIVLQADGKILVGGGFSNIGGQPRNSIARLDPTTGLADSFNPGANFGVFALALQSDGKILAGGTFSNIGGQTRSLFARLSNNTAAGQDLAVTQPAITWTRGGSSPQFMRVTFESSNDNVNYTPLGNGAPSGSNWTLTGLNLPVGQNFYVRARGYHRTGDFSGSESIAESVRNAFLTGQATPSPTPPPTPTASPTPPSTPTATPTPPATPTPGVTPTTLGNISTRLRVETGDNVLIGGFIVTGTQPKKIIVRAIGPSLPLAGALADPVLELRNSSGALIRSNNDWRDDPIQESEINATGIPPSNDLEAAIVETLLASGSAYTAIVRGANDGTGIGVVEAYDLDQTVDSKLANISTRGLVQTGDDVLIGGLIVLGQNPLRVIVRAIGPSLPFSGVLADPTLNLHDSNGTLLISNNDWRDDPAQESEIIATGIPPWNDVESAIVRNLTPGSYTAIVRGVNDTTGIAVVEVYGLN